MTIYYNKSMPNSKKKVKTNTVDPEKKQLSVNSKFLKLANDEKVVFKDKETKNKCNVYKTSNGGYEPEFTTSLKRSTVIQKFLAYWSEDLGTDMMDDKNMNSFLFLTFDGDREVVRSAIESIKHKEKIVWRQVNTVDKSDPMYKHIKDHKFEMGLITLVLRVNKFGSDDVLFLSPYRFAPFELYTNVLLPWKLPVKLDKEGEEEVISVTSNLSMFQSRLFFDEKNKCTFYPSDDPNIYEPYITSNNARNGMIYEIIDMMADNGVFKKEKDAKNRDKIISIRFREGDREFVNTLVNMNSEKFWSFDDLNVFTDPVQLDLIKSNIEIAKTNGKDESIFLVAFYVPKSDECFTYTSFAKKIPESREDDY